MNSSRRAGKLANPAGHWICASCRQHSGFAVQRSFSSLITGGKNAGSRVPPVGQADARTHSHLPDGPARTRFAPSPTGYMHIGGLRTALFSYLLAKKTGGQFILRIEDTDSKRLVFDAEQRLCAELQWAGLQWDEGPQVGGDYGPYKQSERVHIYREYSKQLIDSGAAYRCFCTQSAVKVGEMSYSTGGCHQSCASLPAGQSEERAVDGNAPFTVRLRPVPNNVRGYPDLVHGKVRRLKRSPSGSRSEDGEDGGGMNPSDPVLIKSDGIPTYHFANVIDDHLMKITHVIRGSEWLASLPLHYDLYNAFDWTPPKFAHVGLLVDADGSKLSKRNNSTFPLDIPLLRTKLGILPEVLRNYLALLGWSNPVREDVMSLAELIHHFDLKFTKGNAIVNPSKLWYLQKGHVHRRCQLVQATSSLEPIEPLLQPIQAELLSIYSSADLHTRNLPLKSYIAEVLLVDCRDYTTPQDFVAKNSHFFRFDRVLIPEPPQKEPLLPLESTTPNALISDLFLNFDFSQPYQTTRFAPNIPSPPSAPHAEIDFFAKKIHAAISHNIWKHIFAQYHLTVSAADEFAFHSLDQPRESTAEFAAFVEGRCKESGRTVTKEELLAMHKGSVKILMRVLREKLCYGLPGPGMGHVIAIVGREEICKRLGLDGMEGKGKGW